MRTIALLSRLLAVLSETIKAWDDFRSPEGDCGYFQDISSDPRHPSEMNIHTRRSLRAVDLTFSQLESFQRRLIHLKETCQLSAQAVSHNQSYIGHD